MLALLLAAPLLLAALDCKRCKDTGLAPCPDEARHACTGTKALHCSIASACTTCGGTHKVPCTKCGRAPGPENEAERAAHQAWRPSLGPIEAAMGRPLAHAASAHFLLTYDIPALDVDGGRTLHDGLHLYLDRMEAVYAEVSTQLGAAEADYLGKTHVLLWSKEADQEKAALAFTRQSSSTESKLMGASPVVTIFYDKQWLHEESELHQAVVHQVVHCLLSNVWDGIWPGNIRAGWIDEGFAHWHELALFGAVRHYCYVESDTLLELVRGSWEPPVRAAVDAGSAPGFLGVAGKNTTELTPDDQLYAWSYVDFVLKKHAAGFGPLSRSLKARKPLKDSLNEALALSPFQFEEEWQAFVRENYALKEKKKRR